jgi:hypothetical protein
VLGAAILVVALFALRQPQQHSSQAGSATRTPTTHAASTTAARSTAPSTSNPATPTTSTSPAATGKLPLIVLNNTTIQGLAQQAAQTFQAGGWTVTRYANYTNNIASTCAYYDPAEAGAQQAATALRAQFPAIKRVVPKFAELPAGPIVVVLTPDYVSG